MAHRTMMAFAVVLIRALLLAMPRQAAAHPSATSKKGPQEQQGQRGQRRSRVSEARGAAQHQVTMSNEGHDS